MLGGPPLPSSNRRPHRRRSDGRPHSRCDSGPHGRSNGSSHRRPNHGPDPGADYGPPPPRRPTPEAVIPNVESGATIGFWTFYLSPTFDQYIKDTIARFQKAYPGVTVNWEDHQATFQDDLKNAFAAGNAPDVINLSVGEGWVTDYASQGLLLPLDDKVPADVQSLYFPGLWKEQLVDGKNFQFPWYQGIPVELINKQIYQGTPVPGSSVPTFTGGAGLDPADFPKTIDGLPALCQTIKDKTKTLCDIRLTVNDLLSQMVYEGGVKVQLPTTASPSRSTRRKASPGSRCTSTWSRRARSTRRS